MNITAFMHLLLLLLLFSVFSPWEKCAFQLHHCVGGRFHQLHNLKAKISYGSRDYSFVHPKTAWYVSNRERYIPTNLIHTNYCILLEFGIYLTQNNCFERVKEISFQTRIVLCMLSSGYKSHYNSSLLLYFKTKKICILK